MRVLIDQDPFIALSNDRPWRERGLWPCSWVVCPGLDSLPAVMAYRLRFTVEGDVVVRVHVSADERYQLFLDGQHLGSGPERGAPDYWFYETYELPLTAGDHILVARVWSLGDEGAIAQMAVHPGFLFAPEGEWAQRLGTGCAAWEATVVPGYAFLDKAPSFWRAATVQIDGRAYPWGVERGEGEGWQPVRVFHSGVGRLIDWEFYRQHLLRPALLPPQLRQRVPPGRVRHVAAAPSADVRGIPVRSVDHLGDEAARWQALLQDALEVTLPPHTTRRVVIDLEEYYCAYAEVLVSGGAGGLIRVLRAESLYHEPDVWNSTKGNRDEIEGKYFIGRGDTFLADGGARRHFAALWWEAGRYLELLVQTAEQPMTLHQVALQETRYPLEMESRFQASDDRLLRVMPILVRGMQVDTHETYADSPYYEELMYAGDTRLEILCTYVMTRDDRLPRKALILFDHSRLPSGLTQARYPSRQPQIIAPFAIWWVGMVHDRALWRDDLDFVRRFLPGVRATIEAFGRWIGVDGLLYAPPGWNTFDWVSGWTAGVPPDAVDGPSAPLNWQLVYGLSLAADLERWLGEPELTARYRRWASELAARLEVFWDESRGLYADDRAKQHFSEHTQCMALLSGVMEAERADRVLNALLNSADLARASIYFSFYLFEVFHRFHRVDALLERMELWYGLVHNGLKCPIESPEPSRSDSHAWGSHPLFHYFATILGIRPASPGFRTVTISPQLGPLASASGTLVHPCGEIIVDFREDDGALRGSVALPEGIDGTLIYGDTIRRLPGGQTFFL